MAWHHVFAGRVWGKQKRNENRLGDEGADRHSTAVGGHGRQCRLQGVWRSNALAPLSRVACADERAGKWKCRGAALGRRQAAAHPAADETASAESSHGEHRRGLALLAAAPRDVAGERLGSGGAGTAVGRGRGGSLVVGAVEEIAELTRREASNKEEEGKTQFQALLAGGQNSLPTHHMSGPSYEGSMTLSLSVKYGFQL